VERRLKATPALVKDYVRLFVNRRAYTLQSTRPDPESGRHYYYRPKQRGSGAPLHLTEKTICAHLEGKITIGLYAINPSSQRCKWVAIDADYKNAMEDLLKLQYQLMQDRVHPALEMSRRGHLWIFLETPLLAKECRIYIYNVALALGVPVKSNGLVDGIEVFPKHDQIDAGGFGNAIRGPLGVHRGANRRFWFYGADYTLEAQLTHLKSLPKVSEKALGRFIEGKQMPPGVNREHEIAANSSPKAAGHRTGREFRILEHVGKVRKVGRNYIGRCPSCAEAGHDRSGDNLAVLISDPRYYQCWAGCSKEMIRAALGQPIRRRQIA